MKTPKNDKPAPAPVPPPETPEENNRRMGILIGIAVFWLLLLVVSLASHSRVTIRLLPVVAIIGVAYGIYCSYRLLTKPK